MKNYLYILLFILSGCSSSISENTPSDLPLTDSIIEVDSTLLLVQHMDSIRHCILPEIKKTEKTEIAVKNTVKREKKLKKQLKETKKELKETKKDLKKVQEELTQLKKVAGKRNLIQKVLNIEVDSVEVTDYTKE
tara:strand:- start:13505 stop:13909 length:405 start_codon:yes stop_codon:yes gene_type:complete